MAAKPLENDRSRFDRQYSPRCHWNLPSPERGLQLGVHFTIKGRCLKA